MGMHSGTGILQTLETSSALPRLTLCLEQKRQPPNRGEFSIKSLLLTDLPASKSAEVSANSGEKEEKYRIVLYGWATVHKQFRTYDKIESLRKKSFRNFVFVTSGQRK